MRIATRSAMFLSLAVPAACCLAQSLGPDFSASYSIRNLGAAPGVPFNFGGIEFKAGDADFLLIGGAANSPNAKIYAARLTRDIGGHINGFTGSAQVYASAPYIDGGIDYAPGNVLLYTTYADNTIGELPAGASAPSRNIGLSALGISSSVGSLRIVPQGFPGAGRLKITSYNSSTWYDTTISPDGSGTFNIAAPGASVQIASGPEGIVYVEANNPGFATSSVLISSYGLGRIITYEVNANGDPITSTQRNFITGLTGAEGGTRDPVTGDYLFSTFSGGNQIIVVSGFTAGAACPGDLNHDTIVDDSDFVIFLQAYNLLACDDPAMPAGCASDLNHDQIVDDADFVIFVAAYNQLVCA